MQGLLHNIHQFVVTLKGNDVNSLRNFFTVADATTVPDPKDDTSSVVKDRSIGVIGTRRAFSTMNIGPNVEHTIFGVVSLVTPRRFFQDGGFTSYL